MIPIETNTIDGKKILINISRRVNNNVQFETITELIRIAKQKLIGDVSFIIFSPDAKRCELESEGKQLVFPLRWLKKRSYSTIYAVLKDYGSVEAFQIEENDEFIDTQYEVSLIFDNEYSG